MTTSTAQAALRRHQAPLILGFLYAVHLTVTLLWLQADRPGAVWFADDFVHLAGFHLLLSAMELEGPTALLAYLTEVNSHYPLVGHYPLALVAWLIDPPHVAARLGNSLYFLVLLVSVYHIGRHCQDRRAGLLAAALVSLMPAAYGGMRTVGLDFPAMCLTAPAVLMLLRTEHFSRPRAAALFGLVAGLAALVKGQALMFLAWPAVYALGAGLWQARGDGAALRRTALAAAAAVGVMALVTAVWWTGRAGHLVGLVGAHATGEGMREYEGDISLLSGVWFFFGALPLAATGLMTVATAALLPVAMRTLGRGRWVILIWLVLPLLLHMTLKVRNVRYIFPLVPAMAVLLGAGLSGLRWPRVRAGVAAALGVGAVGLWLACSVVGEDHRSAALSTPLGVVNLPRKHPEGLAAYCATCGHEFYVFPRRAVDFTDEVSTESSLMARTLARSHPGGQGLLLYHTLGTTNLALWLQDRLPASRLILYSDCDWSTSRRPAPASGWSPYLLFTSGELFEDPDVVYESHIRKTRLDWRRGDGAPSLVHLVLQRRDPTAEPELPLFRCEFFPDVE